MKKALLIVSALFVVSLALTSCNSRANDSNNQASTECCGEHGKVKGKDCCDSTKVNAPADSTKHEGCCSDKEHKEPCDHPCEHNHN